MVTVCFVFQRVHDGCERLFDGDDVSGADLLLCHCVTAALGTFFDAHLLRQCTVDGVWPAADNRYVHLFFICETWSALASVYQSNGETGTK